MCHTPNVIRCHRFALWPYLMIWRWNSPQTTDVRMSNRCLLEQVLARWRHPVASSEALDLLHWVMRTISYRCITMAIETASKVGVLFDCCFVDCRHGSRQDGTEWVVGQRQRPVASWVVLNMTHWVMPSVLLRCTAMAIEMANDGGAFVCHRWLFCIM